MFNLFRRRSHRRLLDSFALLDEGKWNAIESAALQVTAEPRPFLLVAHFPWTFNWVQSRLDAAGLDFSVTSDFYTPNQLAEQLTTNPQPAIHLFLAKQFVWEPQNMPVNFDLDVAVVACERYPLADRDAELERYFKAVPALTTLGYFLSLQEPLIEQAIGNTAVTVMQQLGLNEHELITSQILTRRIDRFIKKVSAVVESEIDADSQKDWLAQNSWTSQSKTD